MKPSPVVRRILDRHAEVHQLNLSLALGVSRSAVSMTLIGRRRNPELQEAIARHYGFRPRELWGDWYEANGRGRRQDGRRTRGGERATAGTRPARVAS